MRRFRPSPLNIVLGVLAPVLLVLGVWLGGHPEHLPGFARDTLGDKDTIVLAQAMDTIEDDYVNRIPRATLNDAAIKGAVDALPDQFSSYFSPKEYAAFEDTSHSRFSGVGLNVVGVAQGLRISRVYD